MEAGTGWYQLSVRGFFLSAARCLSAEEHPGRPSVQRPRQADKRVAGHRLADAHAADHAGPRSGALALLLPLSFWIARLVCFPSLAAFLGCTSPSPGSAALPLLLCTRSGPTACVCFTPLRSACYLLHLPSDFLLIAL